MEKQSNNGRKPPAAPPTKMARDRVLKGTKAVQVSEEEASILIGGIVEKGMSGNRSTPPSSAPRLSTLPFPVARHRSHGPHWSPNVSQFGCGRDEDDEDEEADNDPTDYYPIADFAKPVQKKDKKGLDFSRWRECVPSNGSNIHGKDKTSSVKAGEEKQNINQEPFNMINQETLGNQPSVEIDVNNYVLSDLSGALSEPAVAADAITEPISSVAMQIDGINESSSSRGNKSETSRVEPYHSSKIEGSSAVLISGAERNIYRAESQHERSLYDDVDMGMGDFSSLDNRALGTMGSNDVGCQDREMSMQNQIDAENRALIRRMSAEEIEEAQTEIRNRINPELLEILKKRGLQKLEKQKISGSASDTGDVLASSNAESNQLATKGEKESMVPKGNISSSGKDPSMKIIEKRPNDLVGENQVSKGSSLWDAWSKRVEAARIVRYSLDGNVIEGSSLGQTYNADNVAERDFLRMEGDPGAAGYTIKEALTLTRSIVPGQRALALHLLASGLRKPLHNICKSQLDCSMRISYENSVDWEAIWAYALGPEPELVLSLRIALDDNHNSVVLASAKVIQCLLACDVNEKFFDTLEKMAEKDLYTAPVFRSRPDVKHGFLGGGFWKYSAKPSNIFSLDGEIQNDKSEQERTIQDDNVVAGQDVAAGLVRMGILPRLRYILETGPTVALEECLLSILVAIARSSPTCANAIWKCERLVQTIIDRYTMKDTLELQASKIKSVILLRVLAQSSCSICTELIKKGYFQIMTWQLYRVTPSIDEWVKCGRENCKLASELMVEQLRFWKVCIMYGQCISYFSAFFPALCLWMNPPTFDKLIVTNLFHEFAGICTEVYLVLEMLARRLPDLYSPDNTSHQVLGSYGDNVETWCWSDVSPMVNTALTWIEQLSDSTLSKFVYQDNGVKVKFVDHNTYGSSFLWIISAVTHMLHTVLVKATPATVPYPKRGSKNDPLLLDFVANIALQIIKNGVQDFSDQNNDENITETCQMSSFVEKLCYIRHQSNLEASLASVRCLHGLFRVIVSIDFLIQLIRNKGEHACLQGHELYSEILQNGLLKCSLTQWRRVIGKFMKLVASEWHLVQNIEVFGRGGPAPGVGVGWGASGGGFWSLTICLVQEDATLVSELLEILYGSPAMNLPGVAEETFMTQSINSALASSLIAGAGNKAIIQKALDVLLQIPVLKYLDRCIFDFLHHHDGQELFKWEYKEDDLIHFSKILSSHFRIRWLSVKKKKPEAKKGSGCNKKTVKKGGNSLDTIHEEVETLPVTVEDNSKSVTVEWAHQRLPLPSQWLLSPVATINDVMPSDNTSGEVHMQQDQGEFIEVAKAGLFFLLGIEASSSKLSEEDNSPVRNIPLIWKLHSLSVALLAGMGVLEEDRSRGMFEALQSLYGQHLDEAVSHKVNTETKTEKLEGHCLRFQSDIHESYSTFIETLVEQFAAISYGDLAYGRQIAIYLHRQTEASVRLAAWNSLSNAHVLELLPHVDNCLSKAEGYLEPVEDNDSILEAYVKSWSSGSLDRAANRGSVTYTLVLHHLSSFFFNSHSGKKLVLCNKLVKSLLRDYARKQQHEAMMLDLIRYNYCGATRNPEQNSSSSLQTQVDYIDRRFEVLKEACEGNSQLLTIVEKLRSSISK